MNCDKCNDTGLTRCPFNGEAQECPCGGAQVETEGARLGEEIPLASPGLDPADAALMAVQEDAEMLRRQRNLPHTDYLLAAIARAAAAQTLLMERMVWAMESMAALANEEVV